MRRRAVLTICTGLFLGVLAGTIQAGPPPYLVLRTPSAPVPHQPTYDQYPGVGYGVATQSYSYGWFGAQPRQHWSRHFGYYRNFTQWSAK